MTDATHRSPIDWNEFWTEADEQRRESAHVSKHGGARFLTELFEVVGTPDTLASFGCGPAACPIEVASDHPEMDVYGYDAAPSAVRQARENAATTGVENVSFEVARLPDPAVDRRFDVVFCYATLHYVAEVERAIDALYDRVADGGVLVFNYPNRLTRATYRRMVAGESDLPLPGDPGEFRERFALVFDGETLLSYDRIHDLLGRWPRSAWSAVDAPADAPWVGRHNPCVYVPA